MGLWVSETFNHTQLGFEVRQTLFHDKSDFQEVDIVETCAFGRMLLLDKMVMTTEKDEFVYHEMISHVPLLVHPHPRRVLVIGGGDGGTVREVVKHPEVEEVVLCEIDGMVIDVCKKYLPSIACALEGNPKVTINVGDGVAYMAEKASNFDVIIIDSTDPVGIGEGLFTPQFYENARNALNPEGILVAQTESPFTHQAETIRRVYGIYENLFPVVRMYMGHIPTYPGGLWTWSFCSKQYGPELPEAHLDRARRVEPTCKYYNVGIHQGSFLLPNFVKAMVKVPVQQL